MGIPEGGQTANKIALVTNLVTTNEISYARASESIFILDHRVKITRFGQECEEFLVRMLHQCSFRTNETEWMAARGAVRTCAWRRCARMKIQE